MLLENSTFASVQSHSKAVLSDCIWIMAPSHDLLPRLWLPQTLDVTTKIKNVTFLTLGENLVQDSQFASKCMN